MTSRAEFEALCDSGEVHDCRLDEISLDTPIQEVVFTDCVFEAVQFVCDDIRHCKFIECTFQRCGFSSVSVKDCEFKQCRFFDKDQEEGCHFKFANLDGSSFDHCDLSMANFSRANLYRVALTNCQAQGIDLSHSSAMSNVGGKVTLKDMSISESNLAYGDLTGADFESCSITESRLIHSVLSGANLTDCTLTENELHGVTASGLTLVGSDLRGSSINGLDVREIDMAGVTVDSFQQRVLLEAIGIIVAD